MTPTSAYRCLTEARNELRQVRDWLLQPSADTLAACPAALERAVASLREFGTASDPGLLSPAQALVEEIQSSETLLQAASALYFGRLSHLTAPHTETPAPSAVAPPPISVVG